MRIAVPILAVFAAVFLAIMGYFLHRGFGTTGTAFGAGVADQGDANLQATPAPIATDPPGTFTIPQTGSGPAKGNASALPGAQVGGGTPAGPPAPVMAELQSLRARLAHNPKDLAALVGLANLEFDAHFYDRAIPLYVRALALDPKNPDVRTDYAIALHETGKDLPAIQQVDTVLQNRPNFPNALFNRAIFERAIGRNSDAVEDYRTYLKVAPDASRADDAKAALQQLGASSN
jgi:tetratricopeptide (TPR) repeat protein